MGSQGLAAAIRLAEKGADGRGGERIYTDIAGRMLLTVPKTFGLALLALLLAGTILLGWSRRRGLARGAGAVVAALAGSAALVFVAQWAIGLARPGQFWRAHPGAIALAVDLTALAAAAGALAWIGRRLPRETLRAAYWLVFMLLSAGLAFVAPGGAIMSLIPGLLFLVGAVAHRRSPAAETVAAVLAWLFLFVTWAPLIHLSEVTLDFGAAWLFAPLVALILIPALIELLALAEAPALRAALGALGAAALLCWAGVAAAPASSADRKQGFRIEYAWDADAGRGRWLIANGGLPLPQGFPGETRFRRGAKLPWGPSGRWAAPAPAIPLPAPRLEKIGERQVGGGRISDFRLATNGANEILLYFDGAAGVTAAGIAGANVTFGRGDGKEPAYVRCTGRSCDGAVIALTLGKGPVEAIAVGIRYGLPAAGAPLAAARPATAQAQYSPDTSSTWTKFTL
jgi:hypothetical protein